MTPDQALILNLRQAVANCYGLTSAQSNKLLAIALGVKPTTIYSWIGGSRTCGQIIRKFAKLVQHNPKTLTCDPEVVKYLIVLGKIDLSDDMLATISPAIEPTL